MVFIMSETTIPLRYLSIDFFRGATIALMIVVNTPGTGEYVYPPLRHAIWHGCTPTDLVFPSFMFIMGVSMWFAFGKFGHAWSADAGIKIFKRTAFVTGFPSSMNSSSQWLTTSSRRTEANPAVHRTLRDKAAQRR